MLLSNVLSLVFIVKCYSNSLLLRNFRCNISNTRKSVSSDIQTLRSGLKKRGAADFFLTNFEVFGYLIKHSSECYIASQSIDNSWRESKQNFYEFYDN